ncbi:phosphohydrolase [Enterovibrio norvegicus]|uniref:Bifunctional (P)ppGpp synthetase/guanosine-3',5'-bis(Diphosphate) 3'-pyrophosphohydrolase n=1 Tax=Enterovibrio norvegicus TaxID=188144 RepID=A0ABV4KYV8_9GAMM|nr:bifunctional (p)ppGpp synthetase/guanosine-3',5'-bis(diphosphate) 3'-pyrophosphohydrolase [Enterovibrio norvegicus]MCC4798622.1 bifunctional (p)ppGpp synthetase/guanosine-3',5'-bis(diphosphate) 3'-pyrophosphohydrolase [Enterovibrio norvegicus]OEE65172.1 phosphohydrolase [Enterovibrio norvegicus]OEF56985.1 phosphohydrolase [Enterovibrio norvegicus]PMI28761.1 phosphohydrolase [Enterovibrio norvegicus]PMI36947.1 phosphohydrolase [Enterovibrio norvegicus]
MNDRLLLARTFARARHEGQRYGEFPYHVHLDDVERLAQPFGMNAMIIAQLHDVLEDTTTSVDEIVHDFGELIALSVSYVTDPIASDRATRKKQLNSRLQSLDENDDAAKLALIVKACDRLANVKTCRLFSPDKFVMYQSEHAEFRKAAYRHGICEMVWWELDMLIEVGDKLARF